MSSSSDSEDGINNLSTEDLKAMMKLLKIQKKKKSKKNRDADSDNKESESDDSSRDKKSSGLKKNRGSSAEEAVKKKLYDVKISKYDADEYERKLQGELYDKYKESCNVTRCTGIHVKDLEKFVKHLGENCDGLDERSVNDMKAALYTDTWDTTRFEYKFNKGSDSGINYFIFVFAKSRDRKYVDCLYATYNLDFTLSKQEIVTKKKVSFLFNLVSWETAEREYKDVSLGAKSIQLQENFFRSRALHEFCRQGMIDKVNYCD